MNDHDAILRTLRPETVRVPPRDVTLTKNPLLPVLEMANLLNDDSATVAYLDTVSYGSGTANRILVQKSVTVDSDTTLMSKIYYVDVASSLVVETDELMSTSDGGLSKVTRQLQYSNYQNESGIYLATQVVESVAGQNTWNLGYLRTTSAPMFRSPRLVFETSYSHIDQEVCTDGSSPCSFQVNPADLSSFCAASWLCCPIPVANLQL